MQITFGGLQARSGKDDWHQIKCLIDQKDNHAYGIESSPVRWRNIKTRKQNWFEIPFVRQGE